MGIYCHKDGFSYDGYGGGTEEWTDVEIESDISGVELDENDAYAIDGEIFAKDEVVGKVTTLEDIAKELEDNHKSSFRIYDYSGKFEIRENEQGEKNLVQIKKVEGELQEKSRDFPVIYKLEDGGYTTETPKFEVINLNEHFKEVIEGKSDALSLTLNNGEAIEVGKDENGRLVVHTTWDDEFGSIDTLDNIEIVRREDGEYMDADDIDEYLSEESELDKMIEDAIDEFEHPEDYRDYDDYED